MLNHANMKGIYCISFNYQNLYMYYTILLNWVSMLKIQFQKLKQYFCNYDKNFLIID